MGREPKSTTGRFDAGTGRSTEPGPLDELEGIISMADINVFFVGNIGGEVKNNVTPNGHENIKFSVAVNSRRGGNETTTWMRCTAWGGLSKGLTTLAQNGGFASGDQVGVAGSLTGRGAE